MTHYVCDGTCGGSSDVPGVCSTEGCAKEGHDLKPCNCEDGKHSGVLGAENSNEA